MALNKVVVFVAYRGSSNTKIFRIGKSQRRDQFEDLVVDGKKILTLI